MKNTFVVRGMTLGAGMPKICVPVMGRRLEDVIGCAVLAAASQADFVEWRADYYEDARKPDVLQMTLLALRRTIGEMPLLFTLRTAAEGGQADVSPAQYRQVLEIAAESNCVDLIDVEYMMSAAECPSLPQHLQGRQLPVVLSSHNFDTTPPANEMVKRMQAMYDAGANVVKLAVMAHDTADLLALLQASHEYAARQNGPFIAISMGGAGRLSRLAGEAFGSAATFAAVGEASAPGQPTVRQMREALRMLHADGTH